MALHIRRFALLTMNPEKTNLHHDQVRARPWKNVSCKAAWIT